MWPNPGDASVANLNIPKRRLIPIESGNNLDLSSFKQIEGLLKDVKNEGGEFSVVEIEIMSRDVSDSSASHKKLEDINKDKANIYEYILLNINRLLRWGASGLWIVKILGSYDKVVDRKSSAGDGLYGREKTFGNKIKLPTVNEFRKRLGQGARFYSTEPHVEIHIREYIVLVVLYGHFDLT